MKPKFPTILFPALAAGFALAAASNQVEASTWTNFSADGDINNAANWSLGLPNDAASVGAIVTSTPLVIDKAFNNGGDNRSEYLITGTGGMSITPGGSFTYLGDGLLGSTVLGAGGASTITHTGGTLTQDGGGVGLLIGHNAVGTYNISGGNLYVQGIAQTLTIDFDGAGANAADGSSLNISGTGRVDVETGRNLVINAGGTLNVTGNGLLVWHDRTLAQAVFGGTVNATVIQVGNDVHFTAAPRWVLNGNGNWNTPANWSTSTVPNAQSAGAVLDSFGGIITGPVTATLNVPVTLGRLQFDHSFAYTIAGSNALTLDNGGSGAVVTAQSGAHTISAPVTMAESLTATVASSSSLDLAGALSGNAALLKNGTGILQLSGINTYTGATTVSAGTLKIATGGETNNAGPISAVSGGTLQIEGTVTNTGHHYIGAGVSGSGTNIVNSGGVLNVGGAGLWVNIGGREAGGSGIGGNGTLTLNGGNVNIAAGTTWFFNPYAATAPSTLNLNGGTLSTAVTLSDGATSNSNVNFNGGTYQFTAATTPFAGAINLNVQAGGAIFDTGTNNINLAYSLQHSGIGTDGGLTKLGGGLLTLSGINTYDGDTTITGGVLQLGNGGATGSLNTSSAISVGAGAAFAVNRTDTVTQGTDFSSAPITGLGAILQLGSGTTVLNQANTYTDYTYVNAGTLQIDGSYAVTGTGTTSRLLVGSNNGGNGNVIVGSGAGTLTFGGDCFSNAAQVGINNGTGTLTLNGGTTNIAGTTGASTAACLNIGGTTTGAATGTGTVTVNGGTLNVGGRILMGFNDPSSNGTLTLTGGAVNLGTNSSGYSMIEAAQGGVLRMGAGTSAVNLNGGTLSLFAFQRDGATAANAVINFNGGTLKALGTPDFFLSNTAIDGAGALATRVKNGGAIVDTNSFNITIPTALEEDGSSPGGGLTKNGTGTLTLTNMNTYTGKTTVTAGTLILDQAFLADTADVELTTGATLQLDFTGADTIDQLFIDGLPKANGTWGRTGHPTAQNTSGLITGDGLLQVGPPAGYAGWASSFLPGFTNTAANLDFENDGLDSGIEWVVGGNPTLNDAASVDPTFNNTSSPSNFLFTYRRRDTAAADPNTTIIVQYGSNLTGWTTAQNGVSGVSIDASIDLGGGFHQVTVAIPRTLAGGTGKLFARLKVSVAP